MVEIYQNAELNDIAFQVEALDEWKQLAGELGLEKQLEFTDKAESPVPYPYINTSMKTIFETLCPKKVRLNAYNKTPIPLEIMKQAAYSKKESHFNYMEVWYDDKTPDPFLIGVSCKYYGHYKLEGAKIEIKGTDGNNILFDSQEDCELWCISNEKEFASVTEYSWGENFKKYLIGRWGDVVRPFAELKELAKERIVEKFGSELKNTLEETKQALAKLESNATLYLSGEISESQLKGSRW